jgi:hypothetical protein
MIGPKETEASDPCESEVFRSKIFDHLGLVAGMFEELEFGAWIDDRPAQWSNLTAPVFRKEAKQRNPPRHRRSVALRSVVKGPSHDHSTELRASDQA